MTSHQPPPVSSFRNRIKRAARQALKDDLWAGIGTMAVIGVVAGGVMAVDESTDMFDKVNGFVDSIGDASRSYAVELLLGLSSATLAVWLVAVGVRSIIAWRSPTEALGENNLEVPLEQRVSEAQDSMRRTVSEVSALLDRAALLMIAEQERVRQMVVELTEEFKARIETLDDLAARAEQAERRADEARALADISEPSRAAVDDLIDRRLSEHLKGERRGSLVWGFVFTILGALLGIPATLLIANWPF
ncbi:hypothetical protein [Glycomyces sp. NPDC047010]|uniref:hypothetical protein n=1 Tax=Glycomyces sp. NPDC047010 TaxID=3155023 RepID=UPI0033D4E31A